MTDVVAEMLKDMEYRLSVTEVMTPEPQFAVVCIVKIDGRVAQAKCIVAKEHVAVAIDKMLHGLSDQCIGKL